MSGQNYSDLCNIKLRDTELFSNNNLVYNILEDNGIDTLKDLIEMDDLKKINYGRDRINENFFIHSEIEGIIILLRYKYLNEKSYILQNLLEFDININDSILPIKPHFYRQFPGIIFNSKLINKPIDKNVEMYYKLLKKCGFNHFCAKLLLDDMYMGKGKYVFVHRNFIKPLGDYLSNIDLDKIKKEFIDFPNEYNIFFNILTILLEHYKNYHKDYNNYIRCKTK